MSPNCDYVYPAKSSYIPQEFLQSFKASYPKPSTSTQERTDPQGAASTQASQPSKALPTTAGVHRDRVAPAERPVQAKRVGR